LKTLIKQALTIDILRLCYVMSLVSCLFRCEVLMYVVMYQVTIDATASLVLCVVRCWRVWVICV